LLLVHKLVPDMDAGKTMDERMYKRLPDVLF
jgi:hypothetical protein